MRTARRKSFSDLRFGYHIRCSIDVGSLHVDSLLPNGSADCPSFLFRLEPRWPNHLVWAADLLFASTDRSWRLLPR